MKKLIIGLLLAVLLVPAFQGVPQANAQEPPSLSEFVNCVSFFSRVLRVRENRCRRWEFEVKVDGDGGNGGGVNEVVVVGDTVEADCRFGGSASVECPEGMTPLYGKCDAEVTVGNPEFRTFTQLTRALDLANFPTGQIAHSVSCDSGCGDQDGDNRLNVTATALCRDDPLQ